MRPHLEYAIPACSPNLMADLNHLKKFKDWLHNWYLAFIIFLTMRLQRPGLQTLQWRLFQAKLIVAFMIFTGPLDVEPGLSFLPPTHGGLRGLALLGTPM